MVLADCWKKSKLFSRTTGLSIVLCMFSRQQLTLCYFHAYNSRVQLDKLYEDSVFSETIGVSIDDIDDQARSRKRKRLSKDARPTDQAHVTHSGRVVTAPRPSTPTPDEEEIVEDMGRSSGAKKRRKNVDGTSSATIGIASGGTMSSRKRSRVSDATKALENVDISNETAVKMEDGADTAIAVKASTEASLLDSSFGSAKSDVSLRCLSLLLKAQGGGDLLCPSLLQIIDFYVRALLLLNNRVEATMKWCEELSSQQDAVSKKLKSRSRKDGSSSANSTAVTAVDDDKSPMEAFSEDPDYQTIIRLNEEAIAKDFCCAKR